MDDDTVRLIRWIGEQAYLTRDEFLERTGQVQVREQPVPYVTGDTVRTGEWSPTQATNYRVTDGDLGKGGQKEKYHRNIEAIRTLKRIENEGRLATSKEQETLSKYVGWGGIPQAFDPERKGWRQEREESPTTASSGGLKFRPYKGLKTLNHSKIPFAIE